MARPPISSSPKARPAKNGSKKTSNKENPSQADSQAAEDNKNARVIVPWGKEEYFPKTDALLTLIEESPTWRAAFGFDLGGLDNTTPTGKGKTLIQHCGDIATMFFIDGDQDSTWASVDIKILRGVIKNRVNSLKSSYQTFKAQLGETGHGLVITGSAADLTEGSEVANVWEMIEKKFPWYRRMAILVGGNPNHSRKAVSNSQSALDLSILGHEEEEDISRPSSPFDEEDLILDLSSPLVAPQPLSDEEEKDKSKAKVKLTLPLKRSADVASIAPSSKKRKTPQDFLQEMADAEPGTSYCQCY